MSGPRIGVGASGADAAEIARLAGLAEAANVDLLVVGAIEAGAPNGDDTYVGTAAAAVAARTRYLRVGVVLDLRGSAPPLRVAEDLGVLDVLSHGRVELLAREGSDPTWRRDLHSVLEAWTSWPLGEPGRPARSAPVTPAPVQPEIPTWLLAESDPSTARPLARGGGVLFVPWPDHAHEPDTVPDVSELQRLRKLRDADGATTVVFDLGEVPAARRADVVRILGTVVAPCLRCPADEVAILALDATDWLLRRRELHAAPLPDAPPDAGSPHP